ncbi:hypothetical protein BLNAU_16179 [Blattamonas nauphoetae]|uniref:Uncharacterized protein n=1 Tax=Blattamonas nauphoetae TaxID=2049346 RepID=A0ABQ9XEW0_9EUKA|nr:hypothetical protein BLNAU_16179 [Blattamonas nauphoetae]
MTATDATTDTSSSTVLSDCSAFLNWPSKRNESDCKNGVVFRSLVATVKSQPAFDVNLEAKAVEFITRVTPRHSKSADAFLNSFGRATADSLTDYVQSIGVLISSTSQVITTASMELLRRLTWLCSAKVRLSLMKADLIPQLINILNPQSLSFDEAEYIHVHLSRIITLSLELASPDGLEKLGIKDRDEQQAIHETILQQVVIPSEKYICHLCLNRYSIIDGEQSMTFLDLLALIIHISPYYPPAMEFVLVLPVFLTIPSCLTFFETDNSIWYFLVDMNDAQRDWNRTGGETQQMGKTVHRMLRMEGIEDVIEEKLRNDQNGDIRGGVVVNSIDLNNLQGMNLPEQE